MIRLGTRGSLLARTQAGMIADAVTAATGEAVELVVIRTEGDDVTVPLHAPSRPGAFVSALRDALLDDQVDVVVHSFKDLPSEPADGLVVAAIPARAIPFDVMVSRHGGLADLPEGATVGTSSPRRAAALHRARPDLQIVPIRGNIDTRLRKAHTGEVDAVALAAAGLERVGRLTEASEVLDPGLLVPAPAQGALAVECRTQGRLAAILSALDDGPTRLAVTAERAVLRGIEATCATAIGAYAAWLDDETLLLIADLTGHRGVDHAAVARSAPVATIEAAERLGRAVAAGLLAPTERLVVTSRLNAAPAPSPATLPADHPLATGLTVDSPVIRAYRGMRSARRPIWMMRQAGRSLPEYRAVREGTAMLQACLTPDLAAEITCQPVRRHGVDAGIFFSDIVVPLKLAGVGVDIVPGVGPVMDAPVRSAADVVALAELDPQALAPITEAVRLTVAELRTTPLIGFCGAPFTIASYLVEGRPSRDYRHTLAMMAEDPRLWHELLGWVARTTSSFLRAQVLAGASAVQVFDSWIGALTPALYREFAMPHSAAVLAAVADTGVPRVHFGTRSRQHLLAMREAGADVMGVDAQTSLADANQLLGGTTPLQGNIDPALLAADWETLAAHTRHVLADGQAAPGHVVNLGHGVPPSTDPDVLTRLVALVHSVPDKESPDA
ncbi:MAG: uroporphyrinogen decarboxylase [Propionicimonas sp.]